MVQEIFTVYDAVANRYHETFSAPTVEFAKRAFTGLVNKVGHDFCTWAADYTLFHVGTFSQETGLISGNEGPVKVCTALEVKEVEVA